MWRTQGGPAITMGDFSVHESDPASWLLGFSISDDLLSHYLGHPLPSPLPRLSHYQNFSTYEITNSDILLASQLIHLITRPTPVL